MWSINEPAMPPWTDEPVEPRQVLYEYDGPLTFTATFGLFEALFHHLGQRGESRFYAVVQTDEETLDALQSGTLSVRGALNRQNIWIVDFDGSFVVQRYWHCPQDEFPEKLLPYRNAPLFAYLDPAPDTLEEAKAYFSISFAGERISKKSIPFYILKSLIDESYDAARRVLSPVFMAGAKSSTFDFPARAVPGSLILTLEEPLINQTRLRQRTTENPLTVEEAQASFEKQRAVFFEQARELVSAANDGNVSDALAEERFALLDNLQHIIPSDEAHVDHVVFSAKSTKGILSIAVSERAGTRLHRAFKRIERQSVVEVGRVEIVNSPSKTFVYRSPRGRQVTCLIPLETFVRLESEGLLRNGATVRVKGHLRKRPKRDEMTADSPPDILPPPPA